MEQASNSDVRVNRSNEHVPTAKRRVNQIVSNYNKKISQDQTVKEESVSRRNLKAQLQQNSPQVNTPQNQSSETENQEENTLMATLKEFGDNKLSVQSLKDTKVIANIEGNFSFLFC